MTWLDAAIIVVVVAIVVVGFRRGLLKEIWALVSLAVSAFVAGLLYPIMALLLVRFNLPPNGSEFLGFLFLYTAVNILVYTPISLYVREAEIVLPSCQDHVAGAGFALVEGLAFVEMLLILMATYPVLGLDKLATGSTVARAMVTHLPLITWLLPPEFRAMVVFFR